MTVCKLPISHPILAILLTWLSRPISLAFVHGQHPLRKLQIVERIHPAKSQKFALNGRFMERLLPKPDLGGVTDKT
jgi:hypothetical protein